MTLPSTTPDLLSVTVLMPVYNAAAYLAEAVDSILRQTHRDFEFVIVDDGSTDGSTQVLSDFAAKDARIHLIVTEQQGVARALNRGLAEASGEIVVRMDADDIARPERIARQLAFLSEHPDVAAAGSAMQLVERDGTAIVTARYLPNHDAVVNQLYQGNSAIAHPTVAFRRSAVLAVGGYRPLFTYAEDFDLWLRLSDRYRLANLPDVLLDFRCHGQNTSVRHRHEQVLAAYIARLSAQERRQGRPDPAEGLERLAASDLDRFELTPSDRDSILLALSEAGLETFDATGDVRHLLEIEESFFIHHYPHPERARRIARHLVRHWWAKGQPVRSLSVIAWTAKSELATVSGHRVRAQRRRDQRATGAWRPLAIDWLVHCADPVSPRAPAPRRTLPPEGVAYLLEQATSHGVLPAVLRHFPFSTDPITASAKAIAVGRHRQVLAMALLLQQQAETLTTATIGLPVAIVKGLVFARTIYPGIGSRPFTDIDLLVAPDATSKLAAILEDQGFTPAESDSGDDPAERKWLHRDNDALMVEVHTNLVHAGSLRHAMSLAYADIAEGAETPAVQLIVAIVHGSLGGHFEQLRNVADICQAARALTTPEDERRFETLVSRTGARLAAQTGLILAGRCFNEPRCFEIAAALGSPRYAAIAQRLIDPSVVRSTMTSHRWLHAWRRQAFRQLLKAGRHASEIHGT